MIYKKQQEKINNPFLAHVGKQTFYLYPALSQRLHVITRLFGGNSRLLLIIGETGSGKTLLMQQILAQDEKNWNVCRINAHDSTDMPNDQNLRGMKEHRAYMLRKNELPVVMMDQAHDLSTHELSFLIRLTGAKGYQRQIDKLVFFCEPSIMTRLSEFSEMIPEAGAVEKVFMPRFSMAETKVYVDKRLAAEGYMGATFFTPSDIEMIYEESGGCPGGVNRAAAELFNQKNRDGMHLKALFKQFFSK
ncbi:MAG: hypothetical protein KKD44_07875 [Proteobacteria bacterium]|nr:hypothetical protein [Pseudomonadota bacterium]